MSIVLELPLGIAQMCARADPTNRYAQTALAAHATNMAIEEARARWFCTQKETLDFIDERAAANLARLMGEGNG